MPTFPVGVETCQIIYGKGISPTGNAQKAQLQVDLILGGSAQAVVWAGDGTPLLKLVDVFTSPVGEMPSLTRRGGWTVRAPRSRCGHTGLPSVSPAGSCG